MENSKWDDDDIYLEKWYNPAIKNFLDQLIPGEKELNLYSATLLDFKEEFADQVGLNNVSSDKLNLVKGEVMEKAVQEVRRESEKIIQAAEAIAEIGKGRSK
ncbi:MAG: hypothetical protein K0R73_883 [Candidatus Midichloriaceae bacterium]|nr:hypothetical protein [Candidatus Midichloriaceae bacterium]